MKVWHVARLLPGGGLELTGEQREATEDEERHLRSIVETLERISAKPKGEDS